MQPPGCCWTDAGEYAAGAATCSCTTIYDPVCQTSTTTTFPNACKAGCSGITDFVAGECPGERWTLIISSNLDLIGWCLHVLPLAVPTGADVHLRLALRTSHYTGSATNLQASAHAICHQTWGRAGH